MRRTQTCTNICSRNSNSYSRKKNIGIKTFKDTATRGMASVMSVRKDAEECFQDMKENAEDIVEDAHRQDKKEIYVESKE